MLLAFFPDKFNPINIYSPPPPSDATAAMPGYVQGYKVAAYRPSNAAQPLKIRVKMRLCFIFSVRQKEVHA